MSAPPATGTALTQRRISGVAFLLVISSLVYLTVLLYQKRFTPVVKVSLQTDRIGNQLSEHSDVKLHGLVVGEVRTVSSKGDGATIVLALKPSEIKKIPKDVTAQLLPKTLFGEKEVVLAGGSLGGGHLAAHDVIDQDHSSTARETETAINNLLPLLRSLKPAQLSTTLNALSAALRDRGDKLGANLARTAAYLKQLNPSLPTLQQDMAGLADFANNTADATPNLLTVLDNLSASSRYLVEEKASLDAFLTSTQAFASTAQAVVAENESRLVSLAATSKPVLNLYAQYATEFPCLAAGLARYNDIVEATFGGKQGGLHITVEATKDNGGFTPAQTPKYRDTRGPYCDGLPRPKVPAGDEAFDDGYRTQAQVQAGSASKNAASRYLNPTSGEAQSTAVMDTIAGPMLGVPADQVPDLVTLLFGPVAQGNSVGLA